MDSEVIRIEPANWLDLVALNKLSRICFEKDAWPWIDMLAALLAPRAVPLKAVVGESNVIGYVIGDRRRPELGWIASIAVHPDWRERGIGNRLMQEAEDRLGTPVVRLTLRQSNRAALQLYRQRGYRQVKTWPAYYHDGEDGVVMERSLNQDSF
ncbi:MAG: GNAT family N-acetyltransferase [Anaerolineales bacterium]